MKCVVGMLLLLAASSCSRAENATTTAIEGMFVLDAASPGNAESEEFHREVSVNRWNGGIADLFIYLRNPPPVMPTGPHENLKKEVVIESREGSFHPRSAIVRTDQVTRWTNSDSTGFMLQIYGIANSNQVAFVSLHDNVGTTVQLTKPEPIPVPVQADCDPQHAGQWMDLLVVDHPYAAVTDANGRFRMTGLPPGEHSFRVWHRNRGYVDKDWRVVVVPGQTTKVAPVKVARSMLTPVKKETPP